MHHRKRYNLKIEKFSSGRSSHTPERVDCSTRRRDKLILPLLYAPSHAHIGCHGHPFLLPVCAGENGTTPTSQTHALRPAAAQFGNVRDGVHCRRSSRSASRAPRLGVEFAKT